MICGSGYKVWDHDMDEYVSTAHARQIALNIAAYLNVEYLGDRGTDFSCPLTSEHRGR